MMHATMLDRQAKLYVLTGRVQGVGYRPFVYRIANRYQINGWIENRLGQVAIHAEGRRASLKMFQAKLIDQAPVHSKPVMTIAQDAVYKFYRSFDIRPSDANSSHAISIIADLAICSACRNELFDSGNRRYQYPFINCTHCGPRFSIIRQLPYDRINTTMDEFSLCRQCEQEYGNPLDRRFHAEPIACPSCGPGIVFKTKDHEFQTTEAAITNCVKSLRRGKVVALKGVGGYHLICDATSDMAIAQLRHSKPRPDKPLALMLPQRLIPDFVRLTKAEYKFLSSAIHPILLLSTKKNSELSPLIAPGLNQIGVMLPYSPLHELLLDTFNGAIVATSANISGEPVLTDHHTVERRLSHITQSFLHHNRAIERPADDPVYRSIAGQPRPFRLGRGNAPLELTLPFELEHPTLAVGGQMKNTVALAWDNRIVISTYIGDLDCLRSQQWFEKLIEDFKSLYKIIPEQVVFDRHPGYFSHQWAKRSGLNQLPVYHHYAHASCLTGEYPVEKNWLVFTWDGTGLGDDDTAWGGEALYGTSGLWQRVASLRPFFLPGGDKAAQQPWRSAAALCWQAGVAWVPPVAQAKLVHDLWHKKLNCPQTTSVGRLFDAASALVGIIDNATFEGQGPMLLEALAGKGSSRDISLPLVLERDGLWRTDWGQLIEMLLNHNESIEDRSRCLHESLALVILHQAEKLRASHGDFAVGLCGGVFQNRLLTEKALLLLEQQGFRCYLPEKIPLNDAGLCFGQIVLAYHSQKQQKYTND